jgi:predicted Zn-dependent peptidase
MYQVTRLPQGLTVATAEMPHMASVSLGLWVGVGGRYEPAELNGASHFIEHMLFKGTRRRTPRQISQAVEGIGGYLNAFTGEESTCFYARARADRLEHLLEVLMDMFLNSTFEAGALEKEREVIQEEAAMYLDQPQQHVQELLNETLWPDHPLGRPLTGSARSIAALRRDQLLAYRRAHYHAASALVVAAGQVRHEQAVKMVARFSGEFPGGRRASFAPVREAQRAPRLRLFTKDTAQTQLALGVRTCSRHDERRFALRLLNTLLGENMSSRLFQALREDTGLAYSVHSGLSFFDDAGVLVISAGLDADKLPRAWKLIVRESRRFTEAAPGAKEMREARDYLLGQMDLSLEGTESQMMWLGDHWLAYGKILPPAETKRRLSEVTAGEVRRVAREFLRSERLCLALVSPLKSARSLEAGLRL